MKIRYFRSALTEKHGIMNLHEYQAKELLKRYNVSVQEGYPVETPQAAEEAYRNLKVQYGNNFAVVKAQIHAGGRGKGKIKGLEQRGVAVGKNADDIREISANILGGTLVTVQTGEAGKVVNKVLVAQDVYYPGPNPVKEFYLSILLDRTKACNVVMYSTEGGMDIEEVAHKTPEKIFKEWVYPGGGLQPFQARKIAFNLGLSGEAFKSCVNGAGLAMATMDMIKLNGGEPANFLDVGGTANAQTVEAGFRIILKDPKVKAILINIFGGIVRCDRVAQGVIDAYKKIGNIEVPIIVRLQGTNAEEAKKLIEESGLKVQSAILLSEAAALVNKAVSNN